MTEISDYRTIAPFYNRVKFFGQSGVDSTKSFFATLGLLARCSTVNIAKLFETTLFPFLDRVIEFAGHRREEILQALHSYKYDPNREAILHKKGAVNFTEVEKLQQLYDFSQAEVDPHKKILHGVNPSETEHLQDWNAVIAWFKEEGFKDDTIGAFIAIKIPLILHSVFKIEYTFPPGTEKPKPLGENETILVDKLIKILKEGSKEMKKGFVAEARLLRFFVQGFNTQGDYQREMPIQDYWSHIPKAVKPDMVKDLRELLNIQPLDGSFM